MMTHDTIASETDERLRDLIDDSWRDYIWSVLKPFVVTPAMPVSVMRTSSGAILLVSSSNQELDHEPSSAFGFGRIGISCEEGLG